MLSYINSEVPEIISQVIVITSNLIIFLGLSASLYSSIKSLILKIIKITREKLKPQDINIEQQQEQEQEQEQEQDSLNMLELRQNEDYLEEIICKQDKQVDLEDSSNMIEKTYYSEDQKTKFQSCSPADITQYPEKQIRIQTIKVKWFLSIKIQTLLTQIEVKYLTLRPKLQFKDILEYKKKGNQKLKRFEERRKNSQISQREKRKFRIDFQTLK